MAYEIMTYQSENDARLQRRIRFTAHVAAYILFCLVQSLLLPNDLFALSPRLFLFMTLIVHISWMCSATRPVLNDWQPVPQPIPLLPDGQRPAQPRDFQQNDFWYRWHDLS